MSKSSTDRSPLLHSILTSGRRFKVSKGQALPSSDERQDVILIIKGAVKRYLITNDGSLGVQIVYGSGDVFPLTLVFRELLGQHLYKGPEVYHYQAICDTYIYTLSPEEFIAKVKDNPLIYRDLFSEAGQHLSATIHHLENIALSNTYKKVAHILLYFATKFAKKNLRGTKITLPLTQQDVADIVGATRETVSISMTELKKKRLIKTSGRYIVIPDIVKLREEAYS